MLWPSSMHLWTEPKETKHQMYTYWQGYILRIIYLEAVDNPNAYQGITE